MSRGYFGVAVYHPKTEANIGTLWRSAQIMDATFLATIGRRYRKQSSDTMGATRHLPLFEYASFDEFYVGLPKDCLLIAVELNDEAVLLKDFKHPDRAVYLLGAEDHGIPPDVLSKCHRVVKMYGERSMNVAVAGSIVMYDRVTSRLGRGSHND